MIEVDYMILHILGTEHQVADQFGVRRNLNIQRVLHSADRSQRMDRRADSAGSFRERPRIPRVPAFQDDLKTADHGSGAIRVDDLSVLHFRFNAEVPFDPCNGINDDAVCHHAPPFASLFAASLISSLIFFPFLRFVATMWAASPTAVAAPTVNPIVSAVDSIPKPGKDARCR